MLRTRSEPNSLVALLLLIAVLCIFPVLGMSASQYFDTRENVSYRCLVDDYQGDVAVSESALIEAHVTSFPAGRLCIWDGIEGGQVDHQSGWLFTTIGLMGTAFGLLVTIALMRVIGSSRGRWLASLPFLITLGLWLVVFGYGASTIPYIR